MLKVFPFDEPRPGTEEAIREIEAAFAAGKRFVMVDAPTGCHAAGTNVIMYDGTLKKVEEVVVGDLLMGPDGTSREVKNLCRGFDQLYQVKPKKGGEPFVVNGDHILSLRSTNEGKSKEKYSRHKNHKTGNEYVEISVNDYLKKSKYFKHIWKLYRVPIPQWSKRNTLPLDPYLLGLLLGDGSITKSTGITTADEEVRDTFLKYKEGTDLTIRVESKPNNKAKSYYLSGIRGKKGSNSLTNVLRFLEVYGCNVSNKYIPHIYKTASWDERREILAGLIDSDGHMSRNCFDLCMKSEQLIDDIAFVARSIGLCVSKSLKSVKGAIYYRVCISGTTNIVPCRLNRKKAGKREQKKNPLVSGFTIDKYAEDFYYGFELNKDNLYLLEDFTVTHNSGKSGISVAFARKYKSTIWTPTKFLQEQYANTPEFVFEYTIKGKSNYHCGLKGQGHATVDEAICCSSKIVNENRGIIPFDLPPTEKGLSRGLKTKCAEAGLCPYYTKLYNISKTPGATLNYDLGLRIKKQPGKKYGGIDMGESVVLDEAHQLISKANSIFGYSLTNVGVMRLFGQEAKRKKNEEFITWISRLADLSKERLAEEKDAKKVARFTKFQRKLDGLIEMDLENEKKFYIEDRGSEVDIKPLDLRYLKHKIFYPFKQVLMLSATFPANFKDVLGIKDEECAVVRIKSNFEPSNRRVIFTPDIQNMNARTVLNHESDQVRMIRLILDAHKKEKGIIHCGSYKFLKQLRELFKDNPRFIWVDQTKDKEEMFYLHADSPNPTILVSPAMLEGVDLRDDLARFGILLKVPYPVLDEYTKRMNKIFPKWYENLTITNVIQAYGRSVRSKEDHAVFYIIDGAFKMLLNRDKHLINPYFTEALKMGDMSKLIRVLRKKAQEGDE